MATDDTERKIRLTLIRIMIGGHFVLTIVSKLSDFSTGKKLSANNGTEERISHDMYWRKSLLRHSLVNIDFIFVLVLNHLIYIQ